MFDVGPQGRVTIGDYALVNGARFVCDAAVTIGDYALISWNVVLMDTYRVPFDAAARRAWSGSPARSRGGLTADAPARPITIGRNVWIGFDCCVLPGVTIGEGAIVGARSVVVDDVAAVHHRRRQSGARRFAGSRTRRWRMAVEAGIARPASSCSASCSGIRWPA